MSVTSSGYPMESISPAVVQMNGDVIIVDQSLIDVVIRQADKAPEGRSRALLHPSVQDSLHEMLIALPRDSCDVPHINFKSGKSFHVVAGECVAMIFADDGRSLSAFKLSASNGSGGRMLRLTVPRWHTIIPLTPHVVFIETILGPFAGNQFAPWSPKKGSERWQSFVSELRGLSASVQTYGQVFPLAFAD